MGSEELERIKFQSHGQDLRAIIALESRVRELEGERDRLREAIRVAGLDLWCGDTPSDEVVRKLSAALKG